VSPYARQLRASVRQIVLPTVVFVIFLLFFEILLLGLV
jgi:hypothetical protein